MSQAVGDTASFRTPSYLPRFYNYKVLLDHRLETEEVEEVILVDEDSTQRRIDSTVTLPDAATMASYDRLSFDVQIFCPHRNVFACSEWDRIAHIFYCEDVRPSLKEQHPELGMTELAKLLGEGWQSLVESEKKKSAAAAGMTPPVALTLRLMTLRRATPGDRYLDAAQTDKDRYEREMEEGGFTLNAPEVCRAHARL